MNTAAAIVVVLLAALYAVLRVLLMLTAEPCPRCGSKWKSRCIGNWGWREFWVCRRCGRCWEVGLKNFSGR